MYLNVHASIIDKMHVQKKKFKNTNLQRNIFIVFPSKKY